MNAHIYTLGILLTCSQVFAQAETTTSTSSWANDREIVVTATRVPRISSSLQDYAGNTAIITEEDIQKSGRSSISEVIQDVAGINVLDSTGFALGGGVGANVSFRGVGGGDKASTIIMFNGVKLNQAVDNTVLWRAIPLSQVARIEILKGGNASIIYGEGALSGAINIVTKDPSTKPNVRVKQTFGSNKEMLHSVSLSGTQGILGYTAMLEQEQWDGYRHHNKHAAKRGSLDLRLTPTSTTQVRLYHLNHDENTELPGSLSEVEEQDNRMQSSEYGQYWNRYEQTNLSLSQDLSETVRWDSSLYRQERVNDSEINFAGFGFSRAYIDQHKYGLTSQISWDQFLSDNNTLTFGTDISDEAITYHFNTSAENYLRRKDISVFAKNTLRLGKKWVIEPALRYNQVKYNVDIQGFFGLDDTLRYSGYTPGIGIKYNINEEQHFFANFSRAFKVPGSFDIVSVNQLFGANNTDLKAEEAKNYEVGFQGKMFNFLNLKTALYQIDIHNEVMNNTRALPFSRNENFETRRQGLELEWSADVTSQWNIGVNSAFTRAYFRGGTFDKQRIPANPRQRYTLFSRYRFNPHWNMSMDWLIVEDQMKINDFITSDRADDYHVLNLTLNYQKNDFMAFLRFHNILNQKYSAFQSSNALDATTRGESPMPGFAVSAGVEYSF